MPPKKMKKQPKNPFFFFMMDWKKEQEERGNRVPGPLNLLADACTEDWKALPEKDKEYYKEKARKAKEEDKTNLHNKFTTDGKSYAQVQAEEREIENFDQMMKREIAETVSTISTSLKSILSKRFYFIHANHYCYWQAKSIFIPCEVAVAEYSIEQGVMDVAHFFPVVIADEGRLPIGYTHEARGICEKTHNLPLPPFEFAQDYEFITARLLSFLQRSGTDKLPPLYTLENNVNCNNSMSTVKDFLKNCEMFCDATFRTYNLALLFYELRNACADVSIREGIDVEASGFPTKSLAQMELDRDVFHFAKGISCDYHEDLNQTNPEHHVTPFCSLSTVRRWCFLVSDFCCKDLGVALKPGKHCPVTADLTPVVKSTSDFRDASRQGNQQSDVSEVPPPRVNSWTNGQTLSSKMRENRGDAPGSSSSRVPSEPARPTAASASPAKPESEMNDFPELAGVRMPTTRGRGERLLAAINRVQFGQTDDFPTLGAGRGKGRPR